MDGKPHSWRHIEENPAQAEHGAFRSPLLILLALLCTVVTGCGGGDRGTAVVRVGRTEISSATVAHLTHVIERGGLLGGLVEGVRGTPKQQATAFLISTAWLNGEADAQGLDLSAASVKQTVAEREELGGTAKFRKSLKETGETIADLRLEVTAELTAAAIRRKLIHEAPPISEQAIAGYYKQHRSQFVVPERRKVDVIESLPTPAATRALVARIGTGAEFARMAIHKTLRSADAQSRTSLQLARFARAVFAAKPGVVSTPMRINQQWAVFVLRAIIPPTVEPLAQVRSTITELLEIGRQRQLTTEVEHRYRSKWAAATSCRPDYVASGWCLARWNT